MFKFLIFVFLIGFLLTSLLGFSLFRSFKSFFHSDNKNSKQRRTSSSSYQRQRPKARKKIFDNKEGEYIDYEEIK